MADDIPDGVGGITSAATHMVEVVPSDTQFLPHEVPNAPRRAYISWTEFQTPDITARRAHVSWVEMQAPDPPRRAMVSWIELQVPAIGGAPSIKPNDKMGCWIGLRL